ncbi:SH3 domain-containing protein [Levilactobacillus mulengensis]|uniref:hypothetical protein n=1 Tax=Levilactobacillus mulengensis TaxID=2486025 RepID=UPI0013DD9D82|nr:hypothetical protein [Levilactobacillus mulengensis]
MLEVSIINNPFKNPSALGKLSEGVSAIGRQQKQVSASILNNGSELSAVVKAMDNLSNTGSWKQLRVFESIAQQPRYEDLSASMRMLSDNMGRIDKMLSLSRTDISAPVSAMKDSMDKISNMSRPVSMQLSQFMKNGVGIAGTHYTEFQKSLITMNASIDQLNKVASSTAFKSSLRLLSESRINSGINFDVSIANKFISRTEANGFSSFFERMVTERLPNESEKKIIRNNMRNLGKGDVSGFAALTDDEVNYTQFNTVDIGRVQDEIDESEQQVALDAVQNHSVGKLTMSQQSWLRFIWDCIVFPLLAVAVMNSTAGTLSGYFIDNALPNTVYNMTERARGRNLGLNCYKQVVADKLFVRLSPRRSNSPIVGISKKDDVMQAVERKGKWTRVKIDSQHIKYGWVMSRYMKSVKAEG